MTWHTREEQQPSEEHGKRPENRSIQELLGKGLLVVDKPFGPTSKQVTTWIKKELELEKAGHFGTLDPNATGVLPVGLNSGTRIQNILSNSTKEYIFEAELEEEKPEDELEKTLESFRGTNKQVPPEKSAVKREEREREVFSSQFLEKKEKHVLGKVECEAGFYVRTMVEQLGEKLGTGAEMVELRRTRQAHLDETDANKLQDIVDAYHYYRNGDEDELRKILHPVEKAVEHLPKIVIKNSAVNAVANGANLGATGISKLEDDIKKGDTAALMTLKGELVAIAEAEMNSEKMYSGEDTAATLESVHLDPETYPKRWKQ